MTTRPTMEHEPLTYEAFMADLEARIKQEEASGVMDLPRERGPEPMEGENLTPESSIMDAILQGEKWGRLLQSKRDLHMPWLRIDNIVHAIMPGDLVVVGARGKAGKSTFIRNLFDAWVSEGTPCCLIGTEQPIYEMRALWSCLHLRLPTESSRLLAHRDAIMNDIRTRQRRLARTGYIVVPPRLTLRHLHYEVRLAHKMGFKAVLLDHFSRLDFGPGPRWQVAGDAIRQIKRMARMYELPIVVGAQLTNGMGPLGRYEVPTEASWALTSELQRECDVGIQLWRASRRGPTAKELALAKQRPGLVRDLALPRTVFLRVVANRLFDTEDMMDCAKLYLLDGNVLTENPPPNHPGVAVDGEEEDV